MATKTIQSPALREFVVVAGAINISKGTPKGDNGKPTVLRLVHGDHVRGTAAQLREHVKSGAIVPVDKFVEGQRLTTRGVWQRGGEQDDPVANLVEGAAPVAAPIGVADGSLTVDDL